MCPNTTLSIRRVVQHLPTFITIAPSSFLACHLWWLQLYSVLTRSFLTSLFCCCSSIRGLDYPLLLLVAHFPSLMCVRQKRERKVMLLFSLFWWVVVVVPNLSFLALFKIFFQMELSSSLGMTEILSLFCFCHTTVQKYCSSTISSVIHCCGNVSACARSKWNGTRWLPITSCDAAAAVEIKRVKSSDCLLSSLAQILPAILPN